METNQTQTEYLKNLQEQIAAMEPMERACSMAVVNLGNVVVALINSQRWDAINEMKLACNEMFKQAEQIQDGEQNQTLH